MKYLSILSVLLLIGGNFSFASEYGYGNDTPQTNRMTLQEKIKRIKNKKNRMEDQKNVEDNIMETQNGGEEQMNDTRAKVQKMERRHRRGRLRTTQQEPMFDNSGTINVD